MTAKSLVILMNQYDISFAPEDAGKKSQLLGKIDETRPSLCFTKIQSSDASKVELVSIGRNIQQKFDEIFKDDICDIHTVLIENQIGPIANKMKTIQGMLAQYFIMKNRCIAIEFVSSANKLKDFLPTKTEVGAGQKTTYKYRKQLSVLSCSAIVESCHAQWNDFFQTHKKKDDLADCFLQALWYIKHKLCAK
jgi:hypothetical protein